MRLSSVFIYGSVAIIVAASLGFLIYKSLPDTNGNQPSALAERVKELEEDYAELLDQSGKTIQTFSDRTEKLDEDLRRASNLLSEKDSEILQLKNQMGTDSLAVKLGSMLNCQPKDVAVTVSQLISDYQTVQRSFQVVNAQLTEKMANQNTAGELKDFEPPAPEAKDAPPRIKKLELSAPANQWANQKDKTEPAKPDTDVNQDAVARNKSEPNVPVEPQNQAETSTVLVQQLNTQIESLKAELRNREKLLYEQTSLIEDLKKKSRIETGFRTGNNGQIVEPVQPFRDIGTFPVKTK